MELNGLSFKNRDFVIQPLTEIMKLQLSGNRNNYTSYGGLSPLAKQDGKGRGNGYSRGGDQVSTRQKKGSSNQNQTKKISPRQGDNNVGPSSLRKGEPGKQV